MERSLFSSADIAVSGDFFADRNLAAKGAGKESDRRRRVHRLDRGRRLEEMLLKFLPPDKVNEKGSEAAAVTVMMMAGSPGLEFTPPPVPEVYATRPFIYVIRETSTDAILFMGVYKGE